MRNQGLLYQYGWSINTSDITDSGQVYGPARQTLIVTSSSNNHGDQWDIRAAIDPNDIDQTTKIMQAYHCYELNSMVTVSGGPLKDRPPNMRRIRPQQYER